MRRKFKKQRVGFIPVDKVVKGIIKTLENPQKLQQAHLFDLWETLVDEEVKKHATPKKLFGKKLYVSVDDPARAHQFIMQHRMKILSLLQQKVGKENLKDITFQAGRY